MRPSHAVLLTLPLLACAAHEPPPGPAPTPVEPHGSPIPDPSITVAVASVLLEQDCPDPPEAEAELAAGREEARRSRLDGPTACMQSTLQLSLTNNSAAAVPLQIDAIRLLDAASQQPVATLVARKPGLWDAGAYKPWDQRLPVGAPLQVSYRLSEPTWSKGQADADRFASVGFLLLEVDLRVAGQPRTVRSQEFRRRDLDMVET